MEGAARAAGLAPGTRLGRYTLIRRLAVGGMAELYIARQRGAAGFEKIVALKRILPHLAEDPTFTRMFLDEARLASNLDHANLAHVLDFGEYDGEHFLTMEYVHGRNLLQLLRAHKEETLALSAALAIVVRVARGLHDLHEQRSVEGRPLGLVHRDVSPSNVLVAFDGKVKLTDFGIAKAMELTSATRSGTFKGKLGHSSPEQVRGETIDRRSDVFCLGILLYEATTGARAFSGANEFAVLGKVARGDYVAPSAVVDDYPQALASIVARALQTEADARYPTALEVAEAIEEFARAVDLRLDTAAIAGAMRGVFGPAPPVVVAEELRLAKKAEQRATLADAPATVAVRPPSRRPSAVVLLVPLALVAGAGGAWALGGRREAPPPAATAPVESSAPAEVRHPDPPAMPPVARPPSDAAPAQPEANPAERAPLPATAEAAPDEKPRARKRGKKKRKRRPKQTELRRDELYPPE